MNKNINKLLVMAFIFLLSACNDYPLSDNTQVSGTKEKTIKLDNSSAPRCIELTQKTSTKTCYLLWCENNYKGGLTTLYCEGE